MTLGENMVEIDVNPTGNPKVDAVKRASADLIDLIETIRQESPGAGLDEVARLASLAQTHVADASRYAVEAADYRELNE